MTEDDVRLSAVLAAFAPERVGELAALLGGKAGAEVQAAAEALVRAGRSARLAELSRALTPEPAAFAVVEDADDQVRSGRLRRRFRLEAAYASWTSAARTAVQPRVGGHATARL